MASKDSAKEIIEKRLDEILRYHVKLILTYEKRHTVSDLHEDHKGDPVFEAFGLSDLSFTRKRWQAGLANSCATNLGRFTDKATKAILGTTFGLDDATLLKKVTIQANNVTETEETDGVIRCSEIPKALAGTVDAVAKRLAKQLDPSFKAEGLGFELRGRYGKNDDTLLQKDEHMAAAIRALGVVPVLAIFSTSNAVGALRRLNRCWIVAQGRESIDLITELTGFDLLKYLHDRDSWFDPVRTMIQAS